MATERGAEDGRRGRTPGEPARSGPAGILRAGSGLVVGLGLATALSLPTRTEAWSVLGESLDLTQRDFRVCANFTDPEANDNLTPDFEFPGATGAVLAVWKAAVEWGSERHGFGSGDPTQPLELGSGGANFDYSFQGVAPDPGTTNDNVVSQIDGNGAGTMAFTELPIANGWRIRFYAGAAIWDDGPGAPVAGGADLQGVATHELGHALGLGHSNVPGAVMKPNTVGNLVYMRRLSPDDVAGVQAVYGPRAASKPSVRGYVLSGGALGVLGERFAPSGNEVWFTRAATSGLPNDGAPVKVGGLGSSAGGTRIDLVLPVDAGPGDLLVRVPGADGAALSNAYPFDPTREPCEPPRAFGPAKTNSSGGQARLGWEGWPSAAAGGFDLVVEGAFVTTTGVLFRGSGEAALPFQGGTLNVAGPWFRERPVALDFFAGGRARLAVDPTMVGQTRFYQLWYPDPGDPFGVGLSDGLRVTFCP